MERISTCTSFSGDPALRGPALPSGLRTAQAGACAPVRARRPDRAGGTQEKKQLSGWFAYDSSLISISASLEIAFQRDTSDKISLNVPFANSSCNGTVILWSPAAVDFLNRTGLPFCRMISYPNRLRTLMSFSPLTTGRFRKRLHLKLRN